jgi:transcription antitermination factor NusG
MLPWPYWQAGQKGRITDGPLAGIEGIVIGVKQLVRLVLSVTLLKRSVLLEIDADCVSLV